MSQKETGLLALFDHPEKLVKAIQHLRTNHFSKMEAFTPFPLHEVDHALGLKRSFIPWFTLVFGLSGAGLLFLFQSWTSAVSWPLNVGGKPFISWPAFIPITFEGGILFGGVLTVLTLFAIIKLPNYSKKVLDESLTNDKFGLFIDQTDPLFDEAKIKEILKSCEVETVKKID